MADNYIVDDIPVAPLKIAAHKSSAKLAAEVDAALVEYRKADLELLKCQDHDPLLFRDLAPDSFLLDFDCPRFGSGEGKCVINESVRGTDLYVLCDVTNFSNTYTVNGFVNHMSPDDIYSDLKRIIGAAVSSAHRVNVIMPFLYESRQHKRAKRESLDCALALKELQSLGVKNIITFDAHDPKVQNSIPLTSFNNYQAPYAFIKALLEYDPNIVINKESMIVISPDEGAMDRAVYLANNLGVDVGMFYKRRDYSKVVKGRNPIVAHEFLGQDLRGKTALIVDDMISSGESMLDTARELKEMHAEKVIVFATFGLFTSGFDKFDEYYGRGCFDCVITSNLNYKPLEVYEKPWYREANMSRYLASIINSFNYDTSISDTMYYTEKIQALLAAHRSDFSYVGKLF